MSGNVTQVELEERVLEIFYKHARDQDGELNVGHVQAKLDGNFGGRRVELAIQALADAKLLRGSYFIDAPSQYEITESGYKQVEEAYFARLNAVESEKAEADPVESLERKLAPAAGRMVSFGDNQEQKDQLLIAVNEAREIIRSSNQLDADDRDDAVGNISAWNRLVQDSKSFAVDAFKFLVWDRITKVIEKGIEDAYQALLVGLLITLGTIVVGLL